MTQPTTLADFLLARIAEDEAEARESDQDRWRDHTFDIDVTGWFDPARVLAECEAKRRIVELHDATLDEEIARGDASAFGADLMHRDVLHLLALPYGDHPDFRGEWKL